MCFQAEEEEKRKQVAAEEGILEASEDGTFDTKDSTIQSTAATVKSMSTEESEKKLADSEEEEDKTPPRTSQRQKISVFFTRITI